MDAVVLLAFFNSDRLRVDFCSTLNEMEFALCLESRLNNACLYMHWIYALSDRCLEKGREGDGGGGGGGWVEGEGLLTAE